MVNLDYYYSFGTRGACNLHKNTELRVKLLLTIRKIIFYVRYPLPAFMKPTAFLIFPATRFVYRCQNKACYISDLNRQKQCELRLDACSGTRKNVLKILYIELQVVKTFRDQTTHVSNEVAALYLLIADETNISECLIQTTCFGHRRRRNFCPFAYSQGSND